MPVCIERSRSPRDAHPTPLHVLMYHIISDLLSLFRSIMFLHISLQFLSVFTATFESQAPCIRAVAYHIG
jgi:hypothetical protein